jgi:hypothetical protein
VTWFKVDDKFYDHPKSLRLSLAAAGLWVRAGSWCAKQEHDGVIPEYVLPMLANGVPVTTARKLAQQLVANGLWDEAPGIGWVVHDWHEYQPSRADLEAERAANARRQAEWRERKRKEREGDAA